MNPLPQERALVQALVRAIVRELRAEAAVQTTSAPALAGGNALIRRVEARPSESTSIGG